MLVVDGPRVKRGSCDQGDRLRHGDVLLLSGLDSSPPPRGERRGSVQC